MKGSVAGTARPHRVLVVRASALGDVVESLGAVRALARARPELELFWLVQGESLALFEGLDFRCTAVPHQRRPALRGLAATARQLRRLRVDTALDLQGNCKSALLCRLSGAPRRLGLSGPARREPASARLLTQRIALSEPRAEAHPAAAALAVVRGLAPEAAALPPRLFASAAERAREAAALRAVGIDPDQAFRALVLSGVDDPRSWPLTELRATAVVGGVPSVCVLGPAEGAIELPADLPALRHHRGELRRLVALGDLLARCGGEAWGPDRGASHVLAAAGAVTRVLFGPQDPRATAPVGALVLQRADPPACMPCRLRICSHADGPVCMRFGAGGVARGRVQDDGSWHPVLAGDSAASRPV